MLEPLLRIPDHVYLQASLATSVKFTKSSDIHYSTQPSGEPCNMVTSLMSVTEDLKTISEKLLFMHHLINIYYMLAICQEKNPSSPDSRPIFFPHIYFNIVILASLFSEICLPNIPILLWFLNVYKFINTSNFPLHECGLVHF